MNPKALLTLLEFQTCQIIEHNYTTASLVSGVLQSVRGYVGVRHNTRQDLVQRTPQRADLFSRPLWKAA